jgi:prophage regulatory protein
MKNLTILRLPEVLRRVGVKKTALYAAVARGEFPKPIKVLGGRAVGWLEHEVEQAIRDRVEATRGIAVAA